MTRRLSVTWIIVLFAACVAQAQENFKEHVLSSRYVGGPAELVTAPNGAIVNKDVLELLPKTG